MRLFAPLVFAVLLAACGDGTDQPTVKLPDVPPPGTGTGAGARPNAPVTVLPVTEPLTAYGREPVRVGMDEREALAALGLEPPKEGEATAPCRVVRPVEGPPGLYVMIENAEVARVSVQSDSPVRTREGLGVGSTEQQVRAIYGDKLQVGPHKYVEGGKDLTWWADQGAAGLRFETDPAGRVTAVHGGGPAIAYVEGCS